MIVPLDFLPFSVKLRIRHFARKNVGIKLLDYNDTFRQAGQPNCISLDKFAYRCNKISKSCDYGKPSPPLIIYIFLKPCLCKFAYIQMEQTDQPNDPDTKQF